MPSRPLLEEEHEAFRRTARAFIEKEVVPHHEQWEQDGQVSREVWTRAGAQGLLCFDVAEEYGGPGVQDFRYNLVLAEELTRAGAHGPVDKGDHYVLNGSKTFISNGAMADLVVVVARTDTASDGGRGHQGISLLVVERGMAGFDRGRNLSKVGMAAQDTSELFFDDVEVPKHNLLGEEGSGFVSLMVNLPQERLSIAMMAAAACEAVLEMCLSYVKERQAFGRPIGSFQHTRFTIAEMATETRIARVFVDECVRLHLAGELDASGASMAKWWTTELQKKIVDTGVQLFGGYGYMREYPIARAFLDSRVQTIYGGTTEIQKEIIGRSLGL
jgi:alkylation response protein AidB-like acyl-CoA dehydrogenase